MEAAYLNRLAPDVQALVVQVEQGAGLEVEVVVDPARRGRGPDAAGILACDINEYHARILIPTPDRFPEGAVVHELLHIDRTLVQGVPQILDLRVPRPADGLYDLDNALEHLVIVPRELEYRPARIQHWRAVMERVWRHELPATENRHDQAAWARMHWAFLRHVLRHDDLGVAEKLLGELRLTEDAQSF